MSFATLHTFQLGRERATKYHQQYNEAVILLTISMQFPIDQLIFGIFANRNVCPSNAGSLDTLLLDLLSPGLAGGWGRGWG